MSQHPKLIEAWKQRKVRCAQADKFITEYNEHRKAGDTSTTIKCQKLFAEGMKFRAKADELLAQADIVWLNAVSEVYGDNVRIEWSANATNCKIYITEEYN